MWKYPKNLLLYRTMNSLLNNTNLVDNIIALRNIYISENYEEGKSTGWIWTGSKYKNNFYTHQSVEFLREIIIWSWDFGGNIWNENILVAFINNYRNFKGILIKKKLKQDEKIKRMVFFPLSHQQFWYQKIENNLYKHLNFYLNYYSDDDLDNYIQSKLWISYKKLLMISFLLFTKYKEHFYIDLLSEDSLYKNEIAYIIENLSLPLEELQSRLKNEHEKSDVITCLKEVESYWFWEIFSNPLIKINGNFTCPIPIILINRVTNFIYYDFDLDFKTDVLGHRNQDFIFSCFKNNLALEKYLLLDTNDNKSHYKEHNMPPNPDIIIESNNYVLFIECKSNWLEFESTKWEITEQDYNNRIKKNVRQIYKAIDFLTNKVEEGENYFGLSKTKKVIIPIITYIKNPYLWFGKYMEGIISDIIWESKIEEALIRNHIPLIMENISIIDFTNILNSLWIDDFLDEIKKDAYIWWEMEWIINHIITEHKIENKFKFDLDILDLMNKEEEAIRNGNV